VDGEGVELRFDAGLEVGAHHLELTALDASGAQASGGVDVNVIANLPPTARFDAPTAGTYVSQRAVSVEVLVADPDGPDLSLLDLAWTDALAGRSEAPLHPDASGRAVFSVTGLPPGDPVVGVRVTDTEGATAVASVTLHVLSADADGDGALGLAYGGTDCDDADPDVFPGASERCNGVDDDCDGAVDEGALDPVTWYRDADGDGHGAPGDTRDTCSPPSGFVALADDCDDTRASVFPGAVEVCDGRDQDCDGLIDEGVLPAWYRDADGDSYGDASQSVDACVAPAGYRADDTDCDDTSAAIHPGAAEQCNRVDDDCDGLLPVGERTDSDADGSVACADCDDAAPLVHPGASESCNGVDDDCVAGPDDTSCACPVRVYQGRPYQFCGVQTAWLDASAACAASGYHLAAIADAGEDAWIEARIDELPFGYWWIGLNDSAVPDTWVWSDGSPVTYTHWGPSEPNNLLGNEACVELNRFDPNPGWNDQPCDYTWKYVCEFGG